MLYRVTRNTIINKGKKKSEEEWPVSQYEEEESVLSDFSTVLFADDELAPSPETEYMRSLVWQELKVALAELPSEQREVFELMELEGFSVKEVSELISVPEVGSQEYCRCYPDSCRIYNPEKPDRFDQERTDRAECLEGLYNDILTY